MAHVDNSGTLDDAAVPDISTRSAVGPASLFTIKSIVFRPVTNPDVIEKAANPSENCESKVAEFPVSTPLIRISGPALSVDSHR
jgi:hypothetical protein